MMSSQAWSFSAPFPPNHPAAVKPARSLSIHWLQLLRSMRWYTTTLPTLLSLPPAKKFFCRLLGPGLVSDGNPTAPYFTAVNDLPTSRIQPGVFTGCPVPPGVASALGFCKKFGGGAGDPADATPPVEASVAASTTPTASTRACLTTKTTPFPAHDVPPLRTRALPTHGNGHATSAQND